VPNPRTLRKFHLIYLVLDVSISMRKPGRHIESPFERFQLLMPDLVLHMREHIQVRTTCWLSVIAFASEATTVLPATSLREIPTVPPLPAAGQTNYAAALKLLRDRIVADQAEVEASVRPMVDDDATIAVRPLVFFVSDGFPYLGTARQNRSEWLPVRNELAVPAGPAHIAALGLEGAEEGVLADLATGEGALINGFIADGTVAAGALATNVTSAILDSVARSTQLGTMVIKTPAGMRRVSRR
jgi:uncharacterized protein YegL